MKKLMRITTVSLILSCVMANSVFAGKWAGDDGGWRYVRDDGSYQGDGWQEDKGERYYIANGYMKFGWIKDNGKDYFMGVTGAMLRDTVTPDGFKVGSDGAWLGRWGMSDIRILAAVRGVYPVYALNEKEAAVIAQSHPKKDRETVCRRAADSHLLLCNGDGSYPYFHVRRFL